MIEDRVHELTVIAGGERELSGEHLEERHAQRPEIGGGPDRFSAELLRRHAGEGADDDAGGRQARRRGGERQPEVQDLQLAGLGDEQVRGLDVAVKDRPRVDGGEALGGLGSEVQRLFDRNGPGRDPFFSDRPR